MKSKYAFIIIPLVLVLMLTSCKKFIDVDPPITSTVTEVVFSTDEGATGAVAGIYSRMMATTGRFPFGFASGGSSSLTMLGGLSADELKNYGAAGTSTAAFYGNALNPATGGNTNIWSELYIYIYTANTILENLATNTAISPATNTQLTGEAKFIRAFSYFYLTTLYGDVPLLTSSDYTAGSTAPRAPQAAVFSQIIKDLTEAQGSLKADYSISATAERVRPNKWAATALLSRVYTYTNQWAEAEAQATAIIGNTALFDLPVIGSNNLNGLNTVFLKNSKETIWALKPVAVGYNTADAVFFTLGSFGPSQFSTASVALTDALVSSFEPGDLRKTAWTGSVTTTGVGATTYFYSFKYKVYSTSAAVTPAEYNIVFRLAEQYLIRAEARAMQNNLGGASADLNRIRNGAGLGDSPATGQLPVLTAILKEKRVEMFCEWGNRWLELKRTKTVDAVMTTAALAKGTVWNTNAQLFPIPQTERAKNINLTQNPGYN
jgi:hypothetical protein